MDIRLVILLLAVTACTASTPLNNGDEFDDLGSLRTEYKYVVATHTVFETVLDTRAREFNVQSTVTEYIQPFLTSIIVNTITHFVNVQY